MDGDSDKSLKELIQDEEESELFGFIDKLEDPEASKKLSAREKNFYMQCMASLAKLDKKHHKIEKERVREVKRKTGDYMK
jgi:hypothetical protein